ncbi:MAG: EAL domain-containing protein [Oscillospiraceae bacterium]|nr:EAL domain-containing protein [Oscillospiraceae bacterium]
MKRKTITSIAFSVFVAFAIITAYIMVYAYHHREVSELVYLIFNSYAIVALILGLVFVLHWQYSSAKRREQAQQSLRQLVESLASPAMLWNDALDTVIMNDTLRELSELTKSGEGVDAKYIVPWLFGQKLLTETQIREIVRARDREYSFTTKNGTKHDMIWNTAGIEQDENGVTWYLSIGLDLADIRRMQSELTDYSRRLAASEGRHMLTMELTDIGILLIEQGNPNMFPSEKLRTMLGLKGETITLQDVRAKIYPLDLTIFDNHVQTMRLRMRDYLTQTGRLELRIGSADGQYRWYSYRFKATQRTDTGRLVVGGSLIDITPEKEKDQRIERLAYEDEVTGIPNRNGLMKMGRDLYQCTVELGAVYWVIALDIDRFHLINDTCGYENGNQLLRGFAETLKKQLNLGGFGARISGDNFALILRDSGDEDLPAKVVGRIQRSLATLAVGPFANRALTCSAGYARMPADGESFEQVLERAEFALSSGKAILGSIDRYTSAMHDSIVTESVLEKELTDAVMNRQLEVYYQPKVSLDTGRVVGMEALIRWHHPDGRLIPPSVFIPIAERSALITQITRFVLYEACRQTRLWQKLGLPEIVISVNMSSTDFYQENVCAMVQRALEKNDLQPQYLEIELTESLALKDIDTTITRMKELREAGIGIAMDDFGTGYSSLSYIQMLPFTMVKLDSSFILNMDQDKVIEEIVKSVIHIANTKGIGTIAEGVENEAQAELLRAFGCGQVQGFHYGKPMPAKEAEAFMRENMKQHGGSV